MKLLFDANLSPVLVARLAALFPDSAHVFEIGLGRTSSDKAIWEYARSNGFVIVSADSDFAALARAAGPPPQVVQLEKCDYRTKQAEEFLRRNAVRMAEFGRSSRALLIIRKSE